MSAAVRNFMAAWAAVLVLAFAAGAVEARDDDYMRLSARLDLLAADPVLGTRAPAEMELARAALAALADSGRSQRAHWVYMAEQRIDLARAAAEIAVLERTFVDLQREHDRLQLELARRDAAAARAELERQRLQSQIRAEEAARLQAEAEAARSEGEQAANAARAEAAQAKRMAAAQARATALARKEAELAAALGEGGAAAAPASRRLTLADSTFPQGKATLAPGASQQIQKAVAFAGSDPKATVRIEVATTDRAIAEERARVIRDAMVAAGVDASRLTTAASLAKSRRIDIVLQD